jgi:CRISPR-associated endonuclease/helicase Cas3
VPVQDFSAFFSQATGNQPYPYQRGLAEQSIHSRLIHVPTGCGKTAAVVLAWLWQRQENPTTSPRRLVYCLPMRVLVDQTRGNAQTWLKNLGLEDRVGLHVLVGGEDSGGWDLYPEREAILVGTQDMLLSRALNRGYAMSRYRWPMHFGLLHTDCLWVFDEIQLMGTGLATSTQLEAFRLAASGSTSSWWMSATLDPHWLETVNFKDHVAKLPRSKLEDDDLKLKPDDDERTKQVKDGLRHVREASKRLHPSRARMGDTDSLASEVIDAHRGGLTLVVVNTVGRAQSLHTAVQRELKAKASPIKPILIHSRFRPPERERQVSRLLAEPDEYGAIAISTQVVEAGVDVSARTLFTELAPWPSLVQRFGRCNRRGTDNERAQVFWVDLPQSEKGQETVRGPYKLPDLGRAWELIQGCEEVSPASLETIRFEEPFDHKWVIRKKDFFELFDTTPDLAGNDIDIDRYVRDVDESDVQVFWRTWRRGQPPTDQPRPERDELCSVPIGAIGVIGGFREFVKAANRRGLVYRWDYLDRKWDGVNQASIYPGQIYLLHTEAGGYTDKVGWDSKSSEPVSVISDAGTESPEAYDDETLSQIDWQSVADHTDRVCSCLDAILGTLTPSESQVLKLAARWHDWGKAHRIFQDAIDDGQAVVRRGQTSQRRERPAEWHGSRAIAKAPSKWWRRYEWLPGGRKHFRHELASALAVLQRPHDGLAALSDEDLNLVAYLVAAHHGRVRLSIRSLPEEKKPPENRRFARGVWDGDELPAVRLGGGVTTPAITLSLEPMELGLGEEPPFQGRPSWAERMLGLRDNDRLGPCRLAYLETILRAADMRASAEAQERDSGKSRDGQSVEEGRR